LQETEVSGDDDHLRQHERGALHHQIEHSPRQIVRQPNGERERLIAEPENAELVATRRHSAERELAAVARVGGEASADEIDPRARERRLGDRIAQAAAKLVHRHRRRVATHEDDLPRR
jgi:hypothetical protein